MADVSILNVDDYLPGRYARTKVLQQTGFSVIEAGTGREAFQMVQDYNPALVLLDVNLPDMSGFEVCRRIRSTPSIAGTTIVHISASAIQTQHQVRGLDAGADGYIIEPIEPAVLIATVNAFLRARRAEDALRKSSEELRWFTYRVAHDLNEPMRTISVYAEMLQRSPLLSANPDFSESVGFIRAAANRIRAFSDGLIDYAQADSRPAEIPDVDLHLVLKRVTANLAGAIQETGAQIIDKGLPAILTDPRIEHVFQNLILNAIKYRRKDVPPEIVVSSRKDGDFWVISIQDNGMGIEPEYHKKIFEVFRRLHGDDIPGNGLGLALCNKIIEANGGRIWLESKPGSGSTFYFTLPAQAHVA